MLLMLLDTPDPRYQREPEPEPEPGRRWNANLRIWLPLGGSAACFAVAYLVPPFVTFVLTVAGLMLFFDGVLALVPSGDGLNKHQQ
jgi:hypothetical protein